MKPIILTLSLLHTTDAATTDIALSRGAREVLLPTQSPAAIATIVAGEDIFTSIALSKLSRTHPRAAKVLGWTLVGIRGSIVASNVHQLRK